MRNKGNDCKLLPVRLETKELPAFLTGAMTPAVKRRVEQFLSVAEIIDLWVTEHM